MHTKKSIFSQSKNWTNKYICGNSPKCQGGILITKKYWILGHVTQVRDGLKYTNIIIFKEFENL